MKMPGSHVVMTDVANPDGDDFEPRDWPFYWVTQVAGRYLQVLERELKRHALDVARYRVLMSVGDKVMSVGEIAELAIVKLPTMMKIVQRMEAQGLVTSQPRASDGRFTDVALTDRGKALRVVARGCANRLYRASFARVAADEEAQLAAVLEKVFLDLDI